MNQAKPLWAEGLFLRPQHFQRQDTYAEALSRHAQLAANPFAWGIRALELDHEALRSGLLRVTRIDAVFANGDTLVAPGVDQLPPPFSLETAVAEDGAADFCVAVRHLDPNGHNCTDAPDGPCHARYLLVPRESIDLFSDAAEAEVVTLSKLTRLKAGHEALDEYQTLPVARIRRTASNGFELDPAFVPPALCIHGAPALFHLLRRQIDALQAKVDALYGLHREPSKNIIEFRSGDIASFWLLHTASSACAALTHLLRNPALSPERLFQELLRLAGGLLTFSKGHGLADLPAYDHAQPGPCFARLDGLIRELLDTVISTRYFAIALAQP